MKQVCNHPELFERLELKMPFVFKDLSKSEPPSEQGVIENPTIQNPIEIDFPRSAFGSGVYFDSMVRSDQIGPLKLLGYTFIIIIIIILLSKEANTHFAGRN